MYSSFLVGGRGGSVFRELDDAAGDALQFANVLTALADNATNLKTGKFRLNFHNGNFTLNSPANSARGSPR